RERLLQQWHSNARTWGVWTRVGDMVRQEDPTIEKNKKFWRESANIVLGVIGQMGLTLLPIYLVLFMFNELIVTIIVLLIIGFIMKRTRWDRLSIDNGEAQGHSRR